MKAFTQNLASAIHKLIVIAIVLGLIKVLETPGQSTLASERPPDTQAKNLSSMTIQDSSPQGLPSAPDLNAGPDNFGYVLSDSTEPGGPVFYWQDISVTGTRFYNDNLSNYSHPYSDPLPIGFTFPFYGNLYNNVYWSSTGYVSFGEGSADPLPGVFPNLIPPHNLVSPWGMGLVDCDFRSSIYEQHYQQLANPTRFIIQATDVCRPYGYNKLNFQVILFPNGDIILQNKEMYGESSDYVGMENSNGSDGLSYGTALKDNTAILIKYPDGIRFRPRSVQAYGKAGTQANVSVRVTNDTESATAISFTALPGGWPVSLSPLTTPVLPVHGSTTLNIQVSVPITTAVGDFAVNQLLATAIISPSITQTLTITTTTASPKSGYIPILDVSPTALSYLAKLDPALHALVGTVDLRPYGCERASRVAIPPDGETVWVSCVQSNNVIVLSTVDDEMIKVISSVPTPAGIAFSLDGKVALVGSEGSKQVTIINRRTYAKTILALDAYPKTLASHPYLPLIYATPNYSNHVWVINTDSLSVVDTIDLGDNISNWAAVSPNGLRLFTSNLATETLVSDSISIIDTQTNQILDNVPTDSSGSISDITIRLDGDEVIGSTSQGAYSGTFLYFVDPVNAQVLEKFPPDGGIPYSVQALELSCDGSELFFVNSGGYYADAQIHVYGVSVLDRLVTTRLQMYDSNGDLHPDPGAADIVLCPQVDARPILERGEAGSMANPGATVVIPITITNMATSPISDTIILEVGGSNSWPFELSSDKTSLLYSGESAQVTLTVHIPVDASGGFDRITVTARHAALPENQRTLIVYVAIPGSYLPTIVR